MDLNQVLIHSAQMIKVNPKIKVIFYDTLELEGKGSELTAARFNLDKEGNVTSVYKKPKRLTVLTRNRK